MRHAVRQSMLQEVPALAWAIVCVAVAALFPARVSVLHGAILDNIIRTFPQELATFPAAKFMLDILVSFLGIAAFSLACVSAGAPFLRGVSAAEGTEQNIFAFLARLTTSFLIGHWLLAAVFTVLAVFGELTTASVAWTLIAAFAIGILPAIRHFLHPLKKGGLSAPGAASGRIFRFIAGLSAGVLFLALMYSSSRLGYDAAYLYFADPKLTALTHRLRFFLNDLFVVSSFQTGIQFSAIMLTFGDQAARLFSWVSGTANIIFGLALAEKAGVSHRAKAILLAMILTSTSFVDLLGDAKVDLTASAIALAAVYWMCADDHRNSRLLAGFLAGFSAASRPHNAFLMGVFILTLHAVRFFRDKSNPARRRIRSMAVSLVWIGLGSLPPLAFHLAINWAVLGNMFAMLANMENVAPQKWQWALDPQNLWLLRLFYPFVVTFLNTSQSIGNISPLFIAFLPYGLFGSIRRRLNSSSGLLGELLIAALVTLALWISLFFTIMEIRYVFFAWIILFIPAAQIAAAALDEAEGVSRRILSALIVFLLIMSAVRVVYFSMDTYSPLDEQRNPQCSDYAFCEYLKTINQSAAQGDRVLTLLAYRYYLRGDLLACSTRLDEYDRIFEAARLDPQQFWIEAYRQGYKYVAYENNYSVRHLYMDTVPDPSMAPAWMKIETLYGGPQNAVAAYRISVSAPPVKQETICVQNDGVWEVRQAPWR